VFSPHVQTVTAGSRISIGNKDPVIHNVHARLGDSTVFNLGMPLRGVRVKRDAGEPGVVTLQCDSGHTWMRAYIVVVPHGRHATSNISGEAVIAGVAPGTYMLRTWHERLGVIDTPVSVEADKETLVTVLYRGKDQLLKQAVELPPLEVWPSTARGSAFVALEHTASTAPNVEELRALDAARKREDTDTRRARRDADVALGAGLYSRWCATCHGARGDGLGESAGALATRPRDFTRGELEFRSTPSGQLASEEDILRTISSGLPGTDMPAWRGILDAESRRMLARYVMSFSDRYLAGDPPPPILIPPEPPSDEISIGRGRKLYEKLQCAQCHGEDGAADGISKKMIDDWGQPIAASDLTRGVYASGPAPSDRYRTLATGLSGTPMPSFIDQVTAGEMWDLVHYVDSLADRSALLDFFGIH
jgi:mono/diheme cytochrome c family protein